MTANHPSLPPSLVSSPGAAPTPTPADVRAIARDAYIYGFPLVDSNRIQYAYFVDRSSPQFKVPHNQIASYARVFTPADTVVQTPNSDTPYSFVGLDLRAEPIVLTVPPIEKDRYFSIQLIDAYTFNFDYIGSRATGNSGGSYMIAGPGWDGAVPKGIKKVMRAETEFALALYRTQLFEPADIENVKKIQAQYTVQTLSAFLGTPAPGAVAAIDWIVPLTVAEERTSLEFFNQLNFLLQYMPTVPSELALMKRFATVGVGGGKAIDFATMSPDMKAAYQAGMADAWAMLEAFKTQEFETGKVTSGQVFGSRAFLKNNYLYRFAAAALGIYGNSAMEAMYPAYAVDSTGETLTGTRKYTVHFAEGQLPPVNAFWSLTMYELPASLLVDNPINRYLVNSPMLPSFARDADGGLTFYVQHESPGKEKESNWLPAPAGPFAVFMRLYWPKDAALDGSWKQPPMVRV